MTLRLVQLRLSDGSRGVASLSEAGGRLIVGAASTRALAEAAIAAGHGLAEQVAAQGLGDSVDVAAALAEGRVLPPIDHDDPAHLLLTGTGLTHLGSAEERDRMHAKLTAETLTDSMKMFKLGLDGGKPAPGEEGVAPEWFYKGDGSLLTPPEADLVSPAFALDGGDEAEIAALYLIGPDGTPHRLGYALANEFSDHVHEQQNYLYLAHSKLRPSALGPELRVGELPQSVRGTSRIVRDGETIWEKNFLSGEGNMSHSLANLEAHHFKYPLFRRPGDAHVHYLGAAAFSFSQGIKVQPGDRFEIEADAFLLPLHNGMADAAAEAVSVKPL
ncbi:GguC family protein [Sphingomonas sp. LB-2]|uniref:AraD1 family protein n=1 Tax=Sphingomonas caeni TaxID=2984949 RepID=UPI0022315455|nr:AraD1 family protein [Sphingomonas caeni]MCW3846511.1 GguC family protein [Sphingomonas caeni]